MNAYKVIWKLKLKESEHNITDFICAVTEYEAIRKIESVYHADNVKIIEVILLK